MTGRMQATLDKTLYSGQLSPLPSVRWKMSTATWRSHAADWGIGLQCVQC